MLKIVHCQIERLPLAEVVSVFTVKIVLNYLFLPNVITSDADLMLPHHYFPKTIIFVMIFTLIPMKTLTSLSLTRLSVLEFGQFIKTTVMHIRKLFGQNPLPDAVVTNYLDSLDQMSITFDKAIMRVSKSDQTAKILECDVRRDHAVTTAQRFLSGFEYTDDEAEHEAYVRLTIVFDAFTGIQKWNFPAETSGIDSLITKLLDEKHLPYLELLGIKKYINRLQVENNNFKTVFNARIQETVAEEEFDVAAMRKEMKSVYDNFANYVLNLSIAKVAASFDDMLNVLNTVRKYYSDLLARRKPSKTDETPAQIPPMDEGEK